MIALAEFNKSPWDIDAEKVTLASLYEQWTEKKLCKMEKYNMHHTPHECRHTFRSKLDSAGANKKCIDMMMGQKSKEIGEKVYTHKTLDELRATIELIKD